MMKHGVGKRRSEAFLVGPSCWYCYCVLLWMLVRCLYGGLGTNDTCCNVAVGVGLNLDVILKKHGDEPVSSVENSYLLYRFGACSMLVLCTRV